MYDRIKESHVNCSSVKFTWIYYYHELKLHVENRIKYINANYGKNLKRSRKNLEKLQ